MFMEKAAGIPRAFGRYSAPDERDELYRLQPAAVSRTYRMWDDRRWYGDQASTPHCVGYAWAHWLSSTPHRQWIDPNGIYRICQYFDEWEGQDYDGTSVRAGAKVLACLGFIQQYRWAWDVEIVAQTLLEIGPVVVGTVWTEGMMRTDSRGYIRVTGRDYGGHAYLLSGVDVRQRYFRVKNSWSRAWGDRGYAKLDFHDMQRLMDRNGEACIGVEQVARPNNRSDP